MGLRDIGLPDARARWWRDNVDRELRLHRAARRRLSAKQERSRDRLLLAAHQAVIQPRLVAKARIENFMRAEVNEIDPANWREIDASGLIALALIHKNLDK